jgi:orotidine-5'-phosphate decarboxylase
MPLGDSG